MNRHLCELTPREYDVLQLISYGKANLENADELEIKEKTVKNHINAIYSKLNFTNRYQAIVYCLTKLDNLSK